jgi:hypothetical protein
VADKRWTGWRVADIMREGGALVLRQSSNGRLGWQLYCQSLSTGVAVQLPPNDTHQITINGILGALAILPSGASVGVGMERFWEAEPERLVVWLSVLAVLVAVGYYVIWKVRPKPAQREPRASQWLSKFQELHDGGKLSDEEFRTIKTTLASQLQDEVKNSDGGK